MFCKEAGTGSGGSTGASGAGSLRFSPFSAIFFLFAQYVLLCYKVLLSMFSYALQLLQSTL
jgi:hypothetical protein